MKTLEVPRWSRRQFFRTGAAAFAAGAVGLSSMEALAQAASHVTSKITDVQTMTVGGATTRTFVLVKITSDDGHVGIAEAYGSPGVGVAEQIMAIKPTLIGKNPLEIDAIYMTLGDGASSLAGVRTDGSAHGLMRAASGIEMALWDLAGKILDTPTSILLGGRFRDRVRVYDHSGPRDMFDKASCREWADKVRAHPSGFTAHKISIPRTDSIWTPNSRRVPDNGKDPGNRFLTTKEVVRVAEGFNNIREAIGWEHDIMAHAHWEYDLPSSLRLADALADMKPLWLEDPLPVDYTNSWHELVMKSPVPILMGENLTRREGFRPFIVNQGTQFVNPDLRNSGGFLETKRIADLAALYGIPLTLHNSASALHTYQACQWASSIRDFVIAETFVGEGDWRDDMIKVDGRLIEKGYVKVSDRPGTGVELNREVVEQNLAPGETWWG